ncbi:MAG: O-antigen ligase family protein [Tissierellia bacterium]|nr:O-antigen ligase family protein [Tissierellia bacterium]
MAARKISVLFLFALGFLIAGSAFVLQIPYAALLFVGILALVVFYENSFMSLLATVFSYVFLPDLLVLMMCYGIFGLYLFRKITRRTGSFQIYSHEMIPLVYYVLMVVATFTSTLVMGSVRDLAIHTAGLTTMIMITDLVTTKERLYRVLGLLVVAVTLLSLYGIYQYVVGVDILREWVDTASNEAIRARAYSIFGNPNIFAEYLVIFTPLTVFLMWSSKRDKVKIFYALLFVVQVAALFMTMSRGGWIGLASAALMFIFLVRKRLLLFLLPVGAGATLLLPQTFISRFLTIFNLKDSSTSYRFQIWDITMDVIADHFLVGVGLGHQPFKYTFETYIRTMPIFHAHNSFIEIFAELGLSGFILFAIFMASIFALLYKYPLKSQWENRRLLGAALTASFFGMLVHGMFENIFYMTKITLSFWILLSLLYVLVRWEKAEEGVELRREVAHGSRIRKEYSL